MMANGRSPVVSWIYFGINRHSLDDLLELVAPTFVSGPGQQARRNKKTVTEKCGAGGSSQMMGRLRYQSQEFGGMRQSMRD